MLINNPGITTYYYLRLENYFEGGTYDIPLNLLSIERRILLQTGIIRISPVYLIHFAPLQFRSNYQYYFDNGSICYSVKPWLLIGNAMSNILISRITITHIISIMILVGVA